MPGEEPKQVCQWVYKKNIANLVGRLGREWSGITLQEWIKNLEADFETNGVQLNSEKIAEAKCYIDHNKGSARLTIDLITATK